MPRLTSHHVPFEVRKQQALQRLQADVESLMAEWRATPLCGRCGARLPKSRTKPRRWCSKPCRDWGSRQAGLR